MQVDMMRIQLGMVAPHVGAWIEILYRNKCGGERIVAPHVGAWIEILRESLVAWHVRVAPHVGAWIEIKVAVPAGTLPTSLPTWERGLKFLDGKIKTREIPSLPTWERGLK